MDYSKVKQNIINILAIHSDETGQEEMEVAEIASHLKIALDLAEQAIEDLARDGIVGTGKGGHHVILLKKEYAERR